MYDFILIIILIIILILDGIHARISTLDNTWVRRKMSVYTGGVLYITGVRGDNYQGDIAIDDIELVNNRCSNVP